MPASPNPPIPHAAKDRADTSSAGTRRSRAPISATAHNGMRQRPPRTTCEATSWPGQDQAKLAQYAESENIKSLRDEIALARMMVERYWNMMKTDNDFVNRALLGQFPLADHRTTYQVVAHIEQSLQILLGRVSDRLRPTIRAGGDGRTGRHPQLRADRGAHYHAHHGDRQCRCRQDDDPARDLSRC